MQNVLEAFAVGNKHTQGVRYRWSSSFRQLLRFLQEDHGAAKLWPSVPKVQEPAPRAVTATMEERERILRAASTRLRCWLLLCSDLALRSTTAARIAPENYNPETRSITFQTKFGTWQTLPVTAELAELFARVPATADSAKPYVMHLTHCGHIKANMLRKELRNVLASVGITRQLTPHDLRRPTAVKVFEVTHDLRAVQAVLGHRNLSRRCTISTIATRRWPSKTSNSPN